MKTIAIGLVAAASLAAFGARASTLSVPFDFSKNEIALDVTVKGRPLHVLIDTGVDPSVIDQSQAEGLGLKTDRKAASEADGFGDAEHAAAYPATIDGLAIAGRRFGAVEAMTSDLAPLSAHYGRRLDAMLGFSFLHDKIVLIDYPRRRFELFDRAADAATAMRSCRRRWSAPMRLLDGENWPLIQDFRLGGAKAPVTLDTGSSGLITLYKGALDLPGVQTALAQTGEASAAGFRGGSRIKAYAFQAPMGFGPFELPPGQAVTLRPEVAGSADTKLANVGNKLFAALGVKMLLNYRDGRMAFYADCH